MVEDDVLLHAEALTDAQMVEQRALLHLNEEKKEIEPSLSRKQHPATI